jgi:AraC family transcriptional regulator
MQSTARGRIHCWEGGSLWIGEARGDAKYHDHHAMQISLSFHGSIRFRAKGAEWREYKSALVPPHLPHAFEAAAPFTAQLFVEPETVEGRMLLARFGRDAIAELPPGEVARAARGLRALDFRRADGPTLERAARGLIAGLAGGQPPAVIDARVERIIRGLRGRDLTLSLEEAAAAVALSPGRFRHLFVEQTGQSFRSYQLWSRLQRAVELLSGGATATRAAHAAGFSDAPHLTRTFRRMMGIAPTSVRLD